MFETDRRAAFLHVTHNVAVMPLGDGVSAMRYELAPPNPIRGEMAVQAVGDGPIGRPYWDGAKFDGHGN